MGAGKRIKRPKLLARTPILLTEPSAPPARAFVDQRALARWLAQGEPGSDSQQIPSRRKAG
jgi:hypothetical protein